MLDQVDIDRRAGEEAGAERGHELKKHVLLRADEGWRA
jgi:hypothetical protein